MIDSVPVNTTTDPDDFEQAIIDIVDPAPIFDFIEVPSRVLAEDIAAGEPWSARLVEGISDAHPAVGDFGIDEDSAGKDSIDKDIIDADSEVIFEFVMAESGTCPLGPFEALQFDRNSQVLIPVFTELDPDRTCTFDANPHLLLVAVAREDLPTVDFAIATSTGLPQGLEPVRFAAGELAPVE